jgi:hypothetical protein
MTRWLFLDERRLALSALEVNLSSRKYKSETVQSKRAYLQVAKELSLEISDRALSASVEERDGAAPLQNARRGDDVLGREGE